MALLVVALAVLALATACWPGGGARAEELREGARSLVPPGSSVVDEVEADCVELARSPSCVHIYYVANAVTLDERLSAVEEAAESAGWDRISREVFVGGAQLRLQRNGLRASVFVLADERSAACREAPARDCADAIFVER